MGCEPRFCQLRSEIFRLKLRFGSFLVVFSLFYLDISTKILPKSNVKFFFVCNLNIASLRRYRELKKRNPSLNLKDVKKALRIRNILDKNRKNSPLLKHRDSVVIDTGKLNKRAMITKMSNYIEKILSC